MPVFSHSGQISKRNEDVIMKHETSNSRIKLKNESTNNIVWKMPTNIGTAGQVLKINSVVRAIQGEEIDSTSLKNVNQLIWGDADGSVSINNLDVKNSCKVATTANITLTGTQTIDGYSVSVDERVLVKDQSTGSQNGIYLCKSGAWERADDFNENSEVTSGAFTFIEQGTVNSDAGFILTTDGTITVGTTALTFTQFSGAGQIIAGDGLSKSGNTLSVDASQTQITTVGALNGGSITSGFGSIDNGTSAITTTGTVSCGNIITNSKIGTATDQEYIDF